MTLILFTGACLGGSICLLLWLLFPARTGLIVGVGRFDAARAPRVDLHTTARRILPTDPMDRTMTKLGVRIANVLQARGYQLQTTRANLDVVGRTIEAHVGRQVLLGIYGLLFLPLLWLVLTFVGIHLPVAPPLLLGVVLGVVFAFAPELELRKRAAAQRLEFLDDLSSYLNLVAMSMHSGKGDKEALPEVAAMGDSWAYRLISQSLTRGRLSGDATWQVFKALGERLDIQELRDLGGALALVEGNGAKVRESLNTRASSIRKRRLADAKGKAGEDDEQMKVAQISLAMGYMLFLVYPALHQILAIS